MRCQEVFHKLYLIPSKLIREYGILHTVYRGKTAKGSRVLSQTMLEKRTQDTSDMAAVRLITTAEGEELDPQKLHLDSFEAPLALPLGWPYQVHS